MCRKKVGLTGKYHMSVMKTCETKVVCDKNKNSNLIVKFEWPAAVWGAVVITNTSMSYMLLFSRCPCKNDSYWNHTEKIVKIGIPIATKFGIQEVDSFSQLRG